MSKLDKTKPCVFAACVEHHTGECEKGILFDMRFTRVCITPEECPVHELDLQITLPYQFEHAVWIRVPSPVEVRGERDTIQHDAVVYVENKSEKGGNPSGS